MSTDGDGAGDGDGALSGGAERRGERGRVGVRDVQVRVSQELAAAVAQRCVTSAP